jgi:hypothetical protein
VYGMVLFWSHFTTHFSQTGLIFNIETLKSLNGLVLVSVVFLGLILVSYWSHWVSLWSSKWSYLVSFRSCPRRDQNKTKKKDPNKTVETAIRPKEDSFKIKRRPNCD